MYSKEGRRRRYSHSGKNESSVSGGTSSALGLRSGSSCWMLAPTGIVLIGWIRTLILSNSSTELGWGLTLVTRMLPGWKRESA